MATLPTSVAKPRPRSQQSADAALRWSIHLIRRQPKRLPRVLAVLASVLMVSLCVFHSFWLALLPVAAMLFSLSEFLFPVKYTLTAQSASAQHGLTALEIRWVDVRHAYLTDDGIKLSPLREKNARFESLRGVFLRFDDTNRDIVIDTVKRLRIEDESHG